MRRYSLRDDQWDRIRDFLPGRQGHVGITAETNRLFVEAGRARVISSLVGCPLAEAECDGERSNAPRPDHKLATMVPTERGW